MNLWKVSVWQVGFEIKRENPALESSSISSIISYTNNSFSFQPPRTAHPLIRFKCEPQEPIVPPDLPFDKYELEPSPLTQYILERKQPNVCWYCYIMGSSGKTGDVGAPFGYLKASTSMTTVTLTVLPYNFPVLVPLMGNLLPFMQ